MIERVFPYLVTRHNGAYMMIDRTIISARPFITIVVKKETAFAQVLLLLRETGLLRLGAVAIGGTKIDADASTYRSTRYDRAEAQREKLTMDVAELMEEAEHASATDSEPLGKGP